MDEQLATKEKIHEFCHYKTQTQSETMKSSVFLPIQQFVCLVFVKIIYSNGWVAAEWGSQNLFLKAQFRSSLEVNLAI